MFAALLIFILHLISCPAFSQSITSTNQFYNVLVQLKLGMNHLRFLADQNLLELDSIDIFQDPKRSYPTFSKPMNGFQK